MMSIEIKISITIYSNNSFCYNENMEDSMLVLCQCIYSQDQRGVDSSIADCFYVGMTEMEYDEQIATRFSETQLSEPFHMNKLEALGQHECVNNSSWLKSVLKTQEIPEIGIVIKRDLSNAFLVPNDYPFSPFWDDASPWDNYPITEIAKIEEIIDIPFHATKVEIVQGNIVDQDVDVIVNSINKDVSKQGTLSKTIFEQAGIDNMMHAWKNCKEKAYGDIFMTDGFALPAKKVIHCIVPKYDNENSLNYLAKSIHDAIMHADENGYNSIAIPIIGVGGNKYPIVRAIQTIFLMAYHAFPKNIKTIRIVCTSQLLNTATEIAYRCADDYKLVQRMRIFRQVEFIREACKSSAIYYQYDDKYLPSIKFYNQTGEIFLIDRSRHLDRVELTLPEYKCNRDYSQLWELLDEDSDFKMCEGHKESEECHTTSIMLNI